MSIHVLDCTITPIGLRCGKNVIVSVNVWCKKYTELLQDGYYRFQITRIG